MNRSQITSDSDLVSFGNYLLKNRSEGNYLMTNNEVTHADLENWKELNKQEDETIPSKEMG